jgi:hypothetical protein
LVARLNRVAKSDDGSARDRLIAAAERLFAERGVDAISLRETRRYAPPDSCEADRSNGTVCPGRSCPHYGARRRRAGRRCSRTYLRDRSAISVRSMRNSMPS